MALPELYKDQEFQRKSFDRNSEFRRLYGVNASRGDERKFNRYWNSEQRLQDEKAFNAAQDAAEVAHIEAEANKRAASWDARAAAVKEQNNARIDATIANIKASPAAKTLIPRSEAEWNRIASEATNGQLKTMADVEAWQRANGLVDDGKFGKVSSAYWKQHGGGKYEVPGGQIEEVVVTPKKQYYYTDNSGNRYSYADNKLTKLTNDQTKGWESKGLIKDMAEFRNAVDFNNKSVSFGGMSWANPYYLNNAFRTTNNAPDWNQSGEGEGAVVRVKGKDGVYPLRVWNDRSFAIDTKLGKAYELKEDWFGEVDGRGNDAPLNTYDLYSFFDNYNTADQARLKSQKQGGIMERINYFQQGGAAPKQDIKTQITALVQAAMRGDQKATQQVNQIMEAAKAGDQQAIQIAQIMEQVVKELQGQATSAKWGSKLNYIKSLKYARGGKTCPACEKKVEMKACGGKKAKKRYFGGLV